MNNLAQKIEAILFWKNEPMSKKKLAEIVDVSLEDLDQAVVELTDSLSQRGIALISTEDELALGTAPQFSKLIQNLQKEELNKELSRASLETLSIILYKDGVTRSEIDYIRGVNSSFILRALAVRGLVERVSDPNDSRKMVYKPSMDLLRFMGVKSLNELPEYENIKKAIDGAGEKLEVEIKKEE